MSLARRLEVVGHADVQLLPTTLKPCAAAAGEPLGLGDLGEPEQSSVEPTRLSLATRRRGHLHVVEAIDRHPAHRDMATPRDTSATTSQQLPAPSRNTGIWRRTAT